jgi:hypothetical protein
LQAGNFLEILRMKAIVPRSRWKKRGHYGEA